MEDKSLLRVITIILTEDTLPLIHALSETHLAPRAASRVPVSSLRDEITNARVPISELIITCTSARRERITS